MMIHDVSILINILCEYNYVILNQDYSENEKKMNE